MNYHDMFLEPPTHAQRWRGVVITPEDDAKALAECQKMSEAVEAKDDYPHLCISGERVFYFDWPHGLMPGHIYSETGMDEFQISRACEYHFDEWTKEPDDE